VNSQYPTLSEESKLNLITQLSQIELERKKDAEDSLAILETKDKTIQLLTDKYNSLNLKSQN
jgi:hypothetical protein